MAEHQELIVRRHDDGTKTVTRYSARTCDRCGTITSIGYSSSGKYQGSHVLFGCGVWDSELPGWGRHACGFDLRPDMYKVLPVRVIG